MAGAGAPEFPSDRTEASKIMLTDEGCNLGNFFRKVLAPKVWSKPRSMVFCFTFGYLFFWFTFGSIVSLSFWWCVFLFRSLGGNTRPYVYSYTWASWEIAMHVDLFWRESRTVAGGPEINIIRMHGWVTDGHVSEWRETWDNTKSPINGSCQERHDFWVLQSCMLRTSKKFSGWSISQLGSISKTPKPCSTKTSLLPSYRVWFNHENR